MALSRKEYIDKYGEMAVRSTQDTGLFPSVLLTQGIVESNNGNSTLSSVYNNHFGIKADKAWKGKKVNMQTREVFNSSDVIIVDAFRVYDNAEQGFKDRTNFLKTNKRYTTAGVFSAKSPGEQIDALKKAGYATDPDYVKVLKEVLEKNNLAYFDTLSDILKKKV